jgi:hypothetical protein
MHDMPWDPQTAPSRAVLNALVGAAQQDTSSPQRVAQPIATLAPTPDTSYLLYCPEQGGWHVGEWWNVEGGFWTAAIDTNWLLEPTHWLPVPPDPA